MLRALRLAPAVIDPPCVAWGRRPSGENVFELDDESSPAGPTEVMRRVPFADESSPVNLGPLFAEARRPVPDYDDAETPTLELPASRPLRVVPRSGPDPHGVRWGRPPPPPSIRPRASLRPPPLSGRSSMPPPLPGRASMPPPLPARASMPPPPRVASLVNAPPQRPSMPPPLPPPLPFQVDDGQTPSIAPISVDLLPRAEDETPPPGRATPDRTMEVGPVSEHTHGILVADVVPPSVMPAVRALGDEPPRSSRERKSNVVFTVLAGTVGICGVAVAMLAVGIFLRGRTVAEAPVTDEPAAPAAAAAPILVDDLPDNGSAGLSPHSLPDAPRKGAPPARGPVVHAPPSTVPTPAAIAAAEAEAEAETAPAPAPGQTGVIMVPGTTISVMVDGETTPVEYGKVTVPCGKRKVTTSTQTQVLDVPCGGSVSTQ